MIALDVCCNDPDNGFFTGRAEHLRIGICEFAARRQPAPKFVLQSDETQFRLAGKTWPIDKSWDWYGSWCWNRYVIWEVSKSPGWWMVDFLTWLRRRNLYDMDAGLSGLFDWWHREGPERSPAEIYTMIFEAME